MNPHMIIPVDSLCFDIGANVGDVTYMMLKRGARKVIAVDPMPGCVKQLKDRFPEQPVEVVESAVGRSEGEATIHYNRDNDTLASLNPAWMKATRNSGRFHEGRPHEMQVKVTTLDILIEKYGLPAFVKIDAEGFESEIVRGLSQPVLTLSIEFVAEFPRNTTDAVRHLITLGMKEFTYVVGHQEDQFSVEWASGEKILDRLTRIATRNPKVWGNLYARMTEPI